MAIEFARLEFVQRSKDKNMCCKSAYNSRSKIHFSGTDFELEKTYNWSRLGKPAHHEILLPKQANEKFGNIEILWNEAEKAGKRIDSQVGLDFLLALPDDEAISLEDKIILARTFVEKQFVAKGFAAQLDIHAPQTKFEMSEEGEEQRIQQKNWHCHVLITLRGFSEDGLSFEKKINRSFQQELKNTLWSKEWRQHQNDFFEEKGIVLRVDPTGIIPQQHLGPYRMRGDRALSLLMKNDELIELNKLESTNPRKILNEIIKSKSIFSKDDVDRFLHKHLETENLDRTKKEFWELEEIEELLDKHSNAKTGFYSSRFVVEEESQILRLADKLYDKNSHPPSKKIEIDKFTSKLTDEQSQAFRNIIMGKNIVCVEGHAGTGKSFLLAAIKDYYQEQGMKTRALGPDNATARVLEEKGFEKCENIYKFLFGLHNKNRNITSKEVWFIDEAGKLGNRPLLELLKKAEENDVRLIFSGSSSQISSVERGDSFRIFCKKYGSQSLSNIQRQKYEAQREMAQSIAAGDLSHAIDKLNSNRGIYWASDQVESLHNLIQVWAKDTLHFPNSSTLIIARSNKELRVLNELARQVRKGRGELGEEEYQCETIQGKIFISRGDRIEFRKNDKTLGVTNGTSGILVTASLNEFIILLDSEKGERRTVKFDPHYYHSYQLGYASTYYRSQGRTVDRAYVLHNFGMDKKEFYVGITRHVSNVHFFISKEQVKSLSHLKWQLNQSEKPSSTMQFTTQKEIDFNAQKKTRSSSIQELKKSEKFLDRLSGNTLIIWDTLKDKGQTYYQSKRDLVINPDFYNPRIENNHQKKEVTLVTPENRAQTIDQIDLSNNKALPSKHQERITSSERFQIKTKNEFLTYEQLEKSLLENIETLLYRLFPEGPSRKEAGKFRYGNKGSLCVSTAGSKAGSFYNFENQEGGGLLKLVEKTQNLTKDEAKKWAKEFLGIAHTIETPKYFQQMKGSYESKEGQWVSIQPKNRDAPEDLSKLGLEKIANDFKEDTRYAYKDIDGNLLFYTVRMVNKNDPGQKMVLPLSYGFWKNQPTRPHWGFKQYTSTERPLYNLHLINKEPNKPILIVEGEKAADAASRQFSDFTVISWVGGSSAVTKTNWSPLLGKDILIWPDNDKPGFKAANQICLELRKIGVQRLRVIDTEKLMQNFPEKWDLADGLPEGKTILNLRDLILTSKERGVNLAQVVLQLQGKDFNSVLGLKVNEVLWRVDERLRNSLEKTHDNKTWKINDDIVREAVKIISSENEIRLKIQKDTRAEGNLLDRLAFQYMIFLAHNGKNPSPVFIDSCKEKIRDAAWLQSINQKVLQITKDSEICGLVLDRTIARMINDHSLPGSQAQKEASALAISLSKQIVENVYQKKRVIEQSRQMEI